MGMEKKFYEQGYGVESIALLKSMSTSYRKNEINTYVDLKKSATLKKRGFQIRDVENPNATERRYNWG